MNKLISSILAVSFALTPLSALAEQRPDMHKIARKTLEAAANHLTTVAAENAKDFCQLYPTEEEKYIQEKETAKQNLTEIAKAKEAFVIVNQNERKELILQQIHELEQKNNIQVPIDESLLDEIVNLVEYPTAALGRFDEAFLAMPDPIVITPMKDHQRYFPAYQNGKLANCFVFVRNGDSYAIDGVTKGNQRVLTARLKDGEFFYHEDKKTTLAEKAKKLPDVIFQTKLGSYAEKMKRVSKIAHILAQTVQVDLSTQIDAVIPVLKADLVSTVVGEFSELQGIMGHIYAAEEGYDAEVAQAIEEQYLPRFSGDRLPETEYPRLNR